MKDAKRDMKKTFYGKDRKGKSYISKVYPPTQTSINFTDINKLEEFVQGLIK
ncbi:hypothetical protein [Pelosinus propionicus]|uniref:hypothetical protein n=1 Tax=Pelosinus propionicus TaxID=380084 RepID=UPI001587C817|nr:hypothetical protein [Pelosinus propionicus]